MTIDCHFPSISPQSIGTTSKRTNDTSELGLKYTRVIPLVLSALPIKADRQQAKESKNFRGLIVIDFINYGLINYGEMIFIKGLNPNRTVDFAGISGSNLSGVNKRTSKISRGNSEYTTVGPQICKGIVHPAAGP